MTTEVQAVFSPLIFDSSGLNVHQQATAVDDLVVFVHGLNGSGYKSWGEFPEIVFRDSPDIDVAVYNYATGFKRLHKRTILTTKFEFYIDQLTNQLRALNRYERIHLVGHSLGGVLSEFVAKRFIDDHFAASDGPLCQLASLTYFASPRLGSGAALPLFQFLIPEFRILRRLSESSAEIDRVLTRRIQSDHTRSAEAGQVGLPRFACVGGNDRVVRAFSTTFGIPDHQHLPLQESHKSISKPRGSEAPQAARLRLWLTQAIDSRQRIREEAAKRASPERNQLEERSVLIAEYWGGEYSEWEEVFHEARRASSTAEVSLEDKREVDGRLRTDLIVSMSDAGEVVAGSELSRQKADAAFARISEEHRLTVHMAAIGDDHINAVNVLRQWIADSAAWRATATGSADVEGIRLALLNWMSAIVQRRTLRIDSINARAALDSTPVTGNELVGEA